MSKGVNVQALRVRKNRALLYVYRPKQLRVILEDPQARDMLDRFGYRGAASVADMVNRLAENVRDRETFPHEIGLFLGYPVEDVRGFIENKGLGAKMTGVWKVYADVESAVRCFRRFRKCSQIYATKFREGYSLSRLTIAI